MKTGERPPAAVEAHVAPAGKASAAVEATASTVASATLRKSGLR
jgi:hypothetical protein